MTEQINRIAPLRIGVIGCGGIAQGAHLPIIQQSNFEELQAVCDIRPMLAEKVRKRFGAKRVYSRVEDILGDSQIEAVVVCVMHDLHPEIAIEALRRGKHVFIEKPMAMTVDDCLRMINEAASAKLRLFVGYMWRYDKGTEAALKMLTDGVVGEIDFARCGGEEGWHGWEDGFLANMIRTDEPVPALKLRRPVWCGDPFVNFAYEFLMDSGSHTIDLLRAFLGEPEEICFTDVYNMPKSRQRKIEPPLRLMSVIRFPNATVHYNLAFLTHDITGMSLEMRSNAGSLEVRWSPTLRRHKPAVVVYQDFQTGKHEEITSPPSWCFEREHQAFVRSIKDASYEPPTSAELILPVNRICEAIIESWLQKTPVSLTKESPK